MKRIMSLIMVFGLLFGIASQAGAASGGVYIFNPYPNSYGPAPNYIGATIPNKAYKYTLSIQETNNGSLSYYAANLDVPSGYHLYHTLSNSTKVMLAGGQFKIFVAFYNQDGYEIGRDVIIANFNL